MLRDYDNKLCHLCQPSAYALMHSVQIGFTNSVHALSLRRESQLVASAHEGARQRSQAALRDH
jgi:hypothetical protein